VAEDLCAALDPTVNKLGVFLHREGRPPAPAPRREKKGFEEVSTLTLESPAAAAASEAILPGHTHDRHDSQTAVRNLPRELPPTIHLVSPSIATSTSPVVVSCVQVKIQAAKKKYMIVGEDDVFNVPVLARKCCHRDVVTTRPCTW
jgi:hypothetical protein